ncbi:octopamine receptor beta-2R-like [Copidosoma floridanum]|uniref:octopamine receptor beta-2R-like n=1 Tax=Copidosoma floridanum TaxID=29053 RepID=UPI0006C9E035|nr:octopamine receptor beta-2R-like [Copidosoma floridanum]
MYKFIVTVVLAVVIVFGNGMTIIAGKLCPRLFRVTTNHLMLSLTISDLCVGLVTLYKVVAFFEPSLNDYKNVCILKQVCSCGAFLTSLFNVMAIAVDRYIAIYYPFEYPRYMTKSVIKVVVMANWCTAFFISSMPIYWNRYQSTDKCEFVLL